MIDKTVFICHKEAEVTAFRIYVVTPTEYQAVVVCSIWNSPRFYKKSNKNHDSISLKIKKSTRS